MLLGQMMDRPLLVSSIIDYAAEIHPTSRLVSVTTEGGIHRYTYRDAHARICQLAQALVDAGVKPGDRVATLAWNNYRHFELYFAIAGIGAVCHTINPRLFHDQMTYIVNHADDKILFFDTTFTPLVEGLADQFPAGLRYVAMTDRDHMPDSKLPDLGCFEDMISGKPESYDWPEFDENAACGLCYTSGTTGNPKGALFSNRSCVLHALSTIAVGVGCFTSDNVILPVVPLFHVMAWGLPFSGPMTGASFVFPGPGLDGASLFKLMDEEGVNSAWGVPTVWQGLLGEIKKEGRKPKDLTQMIVGGAAAPGNLIDQFERDLGVEVIHGWGMTEMNPVGTLTQFTPEMAAKPLEERLQLKRSQGRRMFGVEMKIVDEDGTPLQKDGVAFGELHVRAPTVVSGYFNDEEATKAAIDKDGWFKTGDVATIDPEGFLRIVDRSKDLIKSGGEWISSIDLENSALEHEGVAACAVIAMPHPKWDERPLLIVVKAEGAEPSKDSILAFLSQKIAKWQLPDDIAFVEDLPLTATGKVSKLTLRSKFQDYKLPTI